MERIKKMNKNNDQTKYTIEKITYLNNWVEHLFSFRITRYEGFKFIPGQFARIGINGDNNDEQNIIWRAYSIVSANYHDELEFYSVVVPNGKFTQKLKNFKIGDKLYIEKISYGLLTTDRFEQGKYLWLFATGTGIGPFISILYDFSIWEQYDKVILVHCVRTANELAYSDVINNFYQDEFYQDMVKDKLIYLKLLTKSNNGADLYGRITDLLINGSIEKQIGIMLEPINSRVMICGNPEMVSATRKILIEQRGLAMSRRNSPGNIAVENYW